MKSQPNVNVYVTNKVGINVNVIKDSTERRKVAYIMGKLGAESAKDFPFWRKVAQNLSEAQITDAIEIAKERKDESLAIIKYASGIFRNMMSGSRL